MGHVSIVRAVNIIACVVNANIHAVNNAVAVAVLISARGVPLHARAFLCLSCFISECLIFSIYFFILFIINHHC